MPLPTARRRVVTSAPTLRYSPKTSSTISHSCCCRSASPGTPDPPWILLPVRPLSWGCWDRRSCTPPPPSRWWGFRRCRRRHPNWGWAHTLRLSCGMLVLRHRCRRRQTSFFRPWSRGGYVWPPRNITGAPPWTRINIAASLGVTIHVLHFFQKKWPETTRTRNLFVARMISKIILRQQLRPGSYKLVSTYRVHAA